MYRKNVAGQYLYFGLVNASTGAALTGATVTGKRGVDGAAQASVTGTITEDAGGQYHLALSQADTNGNDIGFLFTATSAIPVNISIVTTAADPTDSVRFGLSGIPNATAGAVGGLPLGVDSSGRVDVLKVNGTSQTARDLGASVLLSAGTGAGQLDFSSGVVKANIVQILATALTETAGQIAAAFKQFFNIASPTSTMNTVTAVTTATNLTNAPTAGDFTAAMKTSLNTATPAVTVSDKTGFSLSGAGVQAIWDALTSALVTVGSVGKRIGDFLTGNSYDRIGAAGAGLTALGDTRLANLDAAVSTRSTYAGGAVASVTAAVSVTGDFSATMKTSIETAVWEASAAGHNNAGTTGAKLNAASAAGDPWNTALPGAYGAGTAGYLVGHFISVPNSYTGQGSGDTPYVGR